MLLLIHMCKGLNEVYKIVKVNKPFDVGKLLKSFHSKFKIRAFHQLVLVEVSDEEAFKLALQLRKRTFQPRIFYDSVEYRKAIGKVYLSSSLFYRRQYEIGKVYKLYDNLAVSFAEQFMKRRFDVIVYPEIVEFCSGLRIASLKKIEDLYGLQAESISDLFYKLQKAAKNEL